MDLGLVFHCQRGYVSVRHEVSANTCGDNRLPEQREMFMAGINRPDEGIAEPLLNHVQGLCRSNGISD